MHAGMDCREWDITCNTQKGEIGLRIAQQANTCKKRGARENGQPRNQIPSHKMTGQNKKIEHTPFRAYE